MHYWYDIIRCLFYYEYLQHSCPCDFDPRNIATRKNTSYIRRAGWVLPHLSSLLSQLLSNTVVLIRTSGFPSLSPFMLTTLTLTSLGVNTNSVTNDFFCCGFDIGAGATAVPVFATAGQEKVNDNWCISSARCVSIK